MEESPLLVVSKDNMEADDDLEAGFEDTVQHVCGRSCVMSLQALSGMTVASGILLIVVNLFEMIDFRESVRMYAVRSYNLVFGVLIIVGELERPQFVIEYFRFLKSWIAKGLFIAFIGLLTLDIEDSNDSILQTVCALITFCLGALYFLAGILCCPLRTARRYRHIPNKADDDDQGKFAYDKIYQPQTPPAPPHKTENNEPSEGGKPAWLDPRQDQASGF